MAEAPPPVALTIAGSDSSGGAGIQADLKTFAVFSCHGASALTAVTAQNTRHVQAAEPLTPDLISEQIDAVADDLSIAATKTGMLGGPAVIEHVAAAVERHRLAPLVVDPVMLAKSGDALIDDEAISVLGDRLLPLASLVTPNRHEAGRLLELDTPPATVEAAADAARAICDRFGVAACVVKAIRRPSVDRAQDEAVDLCCDGRETYELVGPYHLPGAVHGSGCAFSAAITAALAQGQTLADALHTAKRFIDAAIGSAEPLGGGAPPANPLAWRRGSA
ncbi:MAG: bifunctional hydroxymethylpyrimidine kinase/phosphomethylpyrimidine kinase [Phycisphaeraceae bacterium]